MSIDLLKSMVKNQQFPIPAKYDFQVTVLNTIGGLLHEHPPVQSQVKDAQLLECLIEHIGWNEDLR